MLYKVRKNLRTRRFNHAIAGIFDTPPVRVQDAPWCIVSMVANGDVPMYLLALKSFYSRIGRGKVTAIVDRDMPVESRDILAKHVAGIEFVILEDIPTGACQRGGTWERLLYVLDRSEREYTIQLDADTLTVGEDLEEVVRCAEHNTPFTISDGFELMSLRDVVAEAEVTPSNYIGIVAERAFAEYPGAEHLHYVRGSSGFAGFSRGGYTRAEISHFHQEMEKLVGAQRWREWGTEQSGSNFAIANSPGAVILPRPEYASFTPRAPRDQVKFFHFIGAYRFLDDYYAARGQEEIAKLNPDIRVTTRRRKARPQEELPLAFARTLTVDSALRYLTWHLLGRRYSIWMHARSGLVYQLRPKSWGNSDAGIAYEILVLRYLIPPVWIPPERVRLIVDLGANVGFSCLHWLSTYWATEVIAFEPHPGHVAQFRVNLARNGSESRISLHPVAVGVAAGQAWVSDAGAASQLSKTPGNGYEVPVVDIFPMLAGRRIDILKIDIEGGEYELIEDPRFGELDVRAIVIEWHRRPDRADGDAWCRARLHELGFRTFPIFVGQHAGMMWAYRSAPIFA